jgi:hypothetical protein
MKKAIVIFILLIIAAGVVLFFGWINVKPGFFGVAHSTLTGTVDYALESGRIHWFWQKLVPKSFTVYLVERAPITQSFTTTHPLPGSEQLSEFGSFNLTIQTDIQYNIEFDAAVHLIESGLYENFSEHFSELVSARLGEAVAGFVMENMTRHSQYDEEISYSMLYGLEKRIGNRLSDAVREYRLADASWGVTFVEVPQIELYNDALERYFSHLENVYRFKEEELDRETEQLAIMNEYDMEIERWERYGELIQKYPELLKFFYIEKFSEQADVLVLPQNENTGFPKMLEPWEFPSRTAPKTVETPPPPKKEDSTEEKTLSSPDSEQTLEQPSPDTESSELSEQDADIQDEATWYRKLMFWKYIGRDEGE